MGEDEKIRFVVMFLSGFVFKLNCKFNKVGTMGCYVFVALI